MKKFENIGFTSTVTRTKLTIEIPIKNLVFAFENSPENYEEAKVKRGKRGKFAEFCAKYILEECDQEDGSTYMHKAFDQMFDLIHEGYIDSDEFVSRREQ